MGETPMLRSKLTHYPKKTELGSYRSRVYNVKTPSDPNLQITSAVELRRHESVGILVRVF